MTSGDPLPKAGTGGISVRPPQIHNGSTAVIVNPSSGSGTGEAWVRENLDFVSPDAIHYTRKKGDAERLAVEALRSGAGVIIAVGGDGTLSEVVKGMAADFGQAKLGIVPMGTGNDAARSLGIPLDPSDAVDRLRAGGAETVDVICVEHDGITTHALNAATGGMGGAVNQSMPDEVKDRWGPLAYARAAASAFPDLPVYDLTLVRDGGSPEAYRAVSLVVANGAFAAKGVCVAPGAQIDDGRLSVHLILESGPAALLSLVPALMRREIPDQDNYLSWTCETLDVSVPEGLVVSLDGEVLEGREMKFRAVHGLLAVLGADRGALANPEEAGR